MPTRRTHNAEYTHTQTQYMQPIEHGHEHRTCTAECETEHFTRFMNECMVAGSFFFIITSKVVSNTTKTQWPKIHIILWSIQCCLICLIFGNNCTKLHVFMLFYCGWNTNGTFVTFMVSTNMFLVRSFWSSR